MTIKSKNMGESNGYHLCLSLQRRSTKKYYLLPFFSFRAGTLREFSLKASAMKIAFKAKKNNPSGQFIWKNNLSQNVEIQILSPYRGQIFPFTKQQFVNGLNVSSGSDRFKLGQIIQPEIIIQK